MPDYLVTDSQTGRKFKLTGDSPPTDAELTGIFGAQTESATAPSPRATRRAELQTQQAAAREEGVTTSFSARAGAGIEQGLRTPEVMLRGGLDALQYYRALDAVTGSGDKYQQQNQAQLKAFNERDAYLARETQAIEGREGRNFVGDLVQGVARGVVELPPQLMAGAAGAARGAAVQASAIMGGAQGGLTQFAQDRGEGRSQLEAMPNAIASGLITAVTTRAFGDSGVEAVFRNEGVQGFRRRLVSVLREAGMEGAEEFTDQVQQDLLERATRNPGKPLGDTFYDTMQALGVGVVIGGGVNAPRLLPQRGTTALPDGREVIVNEQTGTTEFPALENDWLPKPGVESQELRVERPALRGEAAMETRPTAEMGLDRTQPSTLNPELSTDLADTIAALRAGYRPEVEQVAPAPEAGVEKFDIEQWRRDVAAAVARPPAEAKPPAPAKPAQLLHLQNLRDKTGVLRDWILKRREAGDKTASPTLKSWAQTFDRFEKLYAARPFAETLEQFAAKYAEDFDGGQMARDFTPAQLDQVKQLLLRQSDLWTLHQSSGDVVKQNQQNPLHRALSSTLGVVLAAQKHPAKPSTPAAPILPSTQPKRFQQGSIHINLRGGDIDTSRPLTGWVLPADLSDFPNVMSTRFGKPGATAIWIPREFVTNSKTRPDKIKEGYFPKPEHIAIIPDEAMRPSGTVDWAKVFKPSTLNPELSTDLADTTPAATGATAQKMPVEQMTPEEHAKIYPVVESDAVIDGREIINADEIPNMSSIGSSVDNPKTLPGIREVPMSDFTLTGRHYSIEGQKKIDRLAEQIKESGQITPLIVVRDGEGSYILEGATRADALFNLGAKSFPAKVVLDLDSISEANAKAKPTPAESGATAQKLPESMAAADFAPPAEGQPDMVVIGCGKDKVSTNVPVPAADLYTGQLFKGRRQAAEASGRPWMVVSAAHGLVPPGKLLSPYNLTIGDLKPEERAEWQRAVRADVLRYFGGNRFDTVGKSIEVHAGADYVKALNKALEGFGITITTPMEGKGIGQQLAQYKASNPAEVRPAEAGEQPKPPAQPGVATPTPKQDTILALLDAADAKLKDAPDSMLEGVTGAPVWLTKAALRGVVQVVRVAYRASKDLALALRAGLEWLRDQNLRGFNEAQAHGWLANTITSGSSVDGLNIRATSDLLAASPLIPDEVRELIANVTYEVVTDQNAVDFANRILDALGDPSAALPILADASNGLGGKQRTVLAFLTLLRLSQAITQAKAAGDTATVQRLAETEAAVYDYTLADRITDAAQTLQAVSVFSKLSPEGRLIHARRRIQRAGDLDLDPLKAQLNDALEKLEKAKQELADETARGREIQEQAAKAIVDALEASAFQPGTPVGKAIAIHVLGQLRQAGVISAVEAEVMRQHYAATDPSLTLAQKLERANIPQPEKRAKQIESERTKAIEAERARLKKRVAALGANPNIDALSLDAVDAALLAGMRQLKLNLGKLVREHWSKVERTGKTLAESLVTEGGLTGEAAQKLANAFERRFNQLAQTKLKRELERVLKPVTRSAIAKPGLVDKLMGLLRLGAFSNEAYWKAVMERLKLPEFSEALRDRLTAIGARLDALPEADIEGRHRVSVEFLNALEQAAGIDPLDLSLGFYVTNLLTGIPTHVANTSANFFAAIANAGIQMELAIAEGRYDDIPAAIEAAAVGLKKALPQAGQVMRTGILPAVRQGQARALRPMELAQFGTRGGVPLRDTGMVSRSAKWALESYPAKILNLWKLNGRAMAAEDLLAFTPAMEVQRVLLARRVARAEGLRGEALRNRVAGLLTDADPAQVEDAREFALRVVNSATPYGLVGAVVNLINQAKGSEHRALRGAANIVAPVLTIPMNAFNESLNYTPVGLWRRRSSVTNLLGREVKNLSLQQQQDLRAELLAKALTGTLFLTAAALMFAQFLDDDDPALALYGTGPQDMADNKGWRERGALPHSLKVGDTYFSFALTPIAAPLSALGNWFDRERDVRIYGKKRSDSLGTQAGVALLSSLDVIFEQPFMVGFVDLFRLAGNTQGSDETKVRSGFRRAAKTASSFVVPNEVRNIDRYFDPKVYPVRDLEGALISSVPFVRGMGGKPALNALGQPIESQPFHRFFSQQASDPLIRGLDAKGAWPTVLDDRNKVWPAKRRAMTEGEFYSYQAETGKALDRKLRAEWPAWSRLPDAIARDKVNEAATKERAIWRSRNGWGRL